MNTLKRGEKERERYREGYKEVEEEVTFPSSGTNAGCVSAALAASSSGVMRVSGTMVSSSGVRGMVMADAITSAT